MTLYKLSEHRMFFVATAVVFRLSLEYGFLVYVSPVHAYAGFDFDLNLLKYIESWIITLVSVLFIPCQLKKASDFLIVIAYAGLLIPLFSLYGLSDHERWIVYAILFQFSLLLLFRSGQAFRLVAIRDGSSIALFISIALVASLSFWYVASGGAANMNFDLSRVYEFRRDASEVIAPGLFGYVNPWIWKIFGPLLLSISLWKRWWCLALSVIVSHVFWFSVANHKAILFYPLIILLLWIWFRKSSGLSILLVGYTAVIFSATALYLVTGEGLPASLFVRRVFYAVANNAFDYYYFFSENAKVLWSSSSVSLGLVPSVYEINPARVIGEWRGTEAHVNNSFLSTGYMHAGWWGLILYGILGGYVLRLIDSSARGPVPLWVAVSTIVISGRSLMLSTDLLTAMLTHGLALGMVMMWLMNGSGFLHRHGRMAPPFLIRK